MRWALCACLVAFACACSSGEYGGRVYGDAGRRLDAGVPVTDASTAHDAYVGLDAARADGGQALPDAGSDAGPTTDPACTGTRRLDPVWVRRLQQSGAGGESSGYAIAEDGFGHVYVAGSAHTTTLTSGFEVAPVTSYAVFLMKVDAATGEVLWYKVHPTTGAPNVGSVAAGPDSVALGAYFTRSGTIDGEVPVAGGGYVVRYDAAGHRSWVFGVQSQLPRVAVTSRNTVIATGAVPVWSTYFGISEWNAGGAEIMHLASPSADQVAVDGDDNVYLAYRQLENVVKLLKLGPDYGLLWQVDITTPGDTTLRPVSLDANPTGGVVLALPVRGMVQTGTVMATFADRGTAVIRVSSGGIPQWIRGVPYNGARMDWTATAGIDAAGNVVATALSGNTDASTSGCSLTGVTAALFHWTSLGELDASRGLSSTATYRSVAMSGPGRIFVTGTSDGGDLGAGPGAPGAFALAMD